MHALHTQEALVVARHTRHTHERAAQRGVDLIGQGQGLLGSPTRDQTAAEVDKGALAGVDGFDGLPERGPRRGKRGVKGQRLSRFIIEQRLLNVLGDVDQHGTRTTRRGNLEGLANGGGKVLDLAHEVVVLGDGQRDARDVDLLEAVSTDERVGHVAGNSHERNRIEVGGGDARHEIGGAGARGGDDHAGLAGGAGVAVGRVGGSLLVGGEHVAQLVLVFVERVVDVDDLPARISKDDVAALLDKGPYDDVRSR